MSNTDPDYGLDDEVAIVTGSTRGIGAAIAGRFAREGAAVIVSGRSESDGQAVVEAIREKGGAATFQRADMRDSEDIKQLVQHAVDEHSCITVVVNNAAVQTETSVTEATLEDWSRVVQTGFRAYWLTVKYAVPHMPADSVVLNISSNHAYRTMPRHFPYNAIKAGVEGMTRAMAVDLGPHGIRANAITPGWVRVERTEQQLEGGTEQHLNRIHPLGRIGNPEEIAGVAAWLASDDASYVTGASILADGGRGAVLQDDTIAAYEGNQ